MYFLDFRKHTAIFSEPGGTSRGVLYQKPSWIIALTHPDFEQPGYGEISIIPGLSVETEVEIESFLNRHKNLSETTLSELLATTTPAIRFALEMAQKALFAQKLELFGEDIDLSIETNGLVWMGNTEDMWRRAESKIQEGFQCLKFKIGALDFDEELQFLQKIRKTYGKDITIRLDANGAFTPDNALEKLEALSVLNIHSIEQPIKAGQLQHMEKLCANSPIPIALDEELIGIKTISEKSEILSAIKPQYVIFKNSLIGGCQQADEWIHTCEKNNVKWWATSALELNIGLNAIAYHLSKYNNPLPQGLGTGKVFTNNIGSNLKLKNNVLTLENNSNDLLLSNTKKLFE